MPRLIIDYPEGMNTHAACYYALQATKDGKISVAAGVPHFCWGTKFQNGVMVATRRKKSGQKSDSLIVYREQDYVKTSQQAKESQEGI